MTTITKYPTVIPSNPDTWTNPNNALGAPDALCASKNTVSTAQKKLPVSTFNFGLPANAVLDSISLNLDGVIDSSTDGGLSLAWHVPAVWPHGEFIFVSQSSHAMPGGNCAVVAWTVDEDILPSLKSNNVVPTIADLNSETGFDLYLLATPDSGAAHRFYVDACYVKIVYHVPLTAVGTQNSNLFIYQYFILQIDLTEKKENGKAQSSKNKKALAVILSTETQKQKLQKLLQAQG